MESVTWLIIFVALLAIELATLGLTTVWFAGGALAAFFVSLLGGNLLLEIIVFIIVSVVLLYFTRPIAMKYLNANRTKTNYEALIGTDAKVITKIDNFNQTGSVMVNGIEWTARSKDEGKLIMPNARVTITKVSGVKLIVSEKKEDN